MLTASRTPELKLLEAMLEKSPYPQCIISRSYQLLAVNQAYRDRYKRSGPLVGLTCHQASHGSAVPCAENGESCPLLHCVSSRAPSSVLHIHDEVQGRRKVRIEMEPLFDPKGKPFAFIETIRPQVDHERRGIVLFDVAGFLHQGLNPHSVDVESINKRQQKMLEVMHKELEAERACRLASGCNVPLVEHFVCTGDGYYMICNPNTETILDIAHCIRGLLDAHSIPAYIIGHVGPVHTFVDLTGRTNVTSYAMGVAARIQGLAKDTSGLICSEDLVEHWVDNEYYDLTAPVREGTAKDGVTFRWRMAQRLGPLPQQS